MTTSLSELIAGLPVTWSREAAGDEAGQGLANRDPAIRGVRHDSRRVEPGDLFVAIAGGRFDGRDFAPQAIARGSAAIVAAGPPTQELDTDVPWLEAREPRALLGPLAARVYEHPDRDLCLVGVTGTNGKSTVVTLAAAMLEAAGRKAGTVGTLGYRLGDRLFAGDRTTPEASDLFRILREMRDSGAQAVTMEVSSHALSQHRVTGVAFDVAVFTNLTRDHFDFHDGFDDYFAAKQKLFHQLAPGGRAVVNLDDSYGRRLAAELPGALGYGAGGEVRVTQVELEGSGSRGVVETPRGPLHFSTPLLGRFNLSNLLAAVAVAEVLELPHEAVAAALAAQPPLEGRLQPVGRGRPILAFVDYAHTPGALEAALSSLREIGGEGRILAVFGCGGDRDPGKRALMGEIAGRLADLPILTSDNPRGEDPLAIIEAVEEGLERVPGISWRSLPDRRAAIRLAIGQARPGDLVLVAGKGHETGQQIGDQQIPFSDEEEIEKALEDRFGAVADG